jgi:hypothetical protein
MLLTKFGTIPNVCSYSLLLSYELLAMDVLDPASMKAAANCISQYDTQTSKNHQIVERIWRPSLSSVGMFNSVSYSLMHLTLLSKLV